MLRTSYFCSKNWISTKKYQAMIIRNQCTKTEKTCIIVKNKSIAETDSLMLLGIAVDCKLNFNEHISNVCRKASQRIGVIMRLTKSYTN